AEAAQELALPLEPSSTVVVQRGAHDLHGHVSTGGGLTGPVHGGEPAAADDGEVGKPRDDRSAVAHRSPRLRQDGTRPRSRLFPIARMTPTRLCLRPAEGDETGIRHRLRTRSDAMARPGV